MASVVQLEAFEASIKGRRLKWFLAQDAAIAYPPGAQEQIFSEVPPFQRRVLLLATTSSEAWKLVDRWDAVFVVQNGVEWSVVLSYIQNTTAPALVVLAPEVQAPPAFFQKAAHLGPKTPTLLCFAYLAAATHQPLVAYDAVFFPPPRDIEQCLEQTQGILAGLVSNETLKTFHLRDAIRDLQSAGATLVISSIEESSPSLYWYYTSETQQSQQRRLLETVVHTLIKRQQ